MFSWRAGSPSVVASCGGTTPSPSEYRQDSGTCSGARSRSFLARGCIVCAVGPAGCAISRYMALTSGGEALPSGSTLIGLPSVITERTHSGAWCAP
ncbi:hypothetical protein CKO44_19045 [Rubrivivax gelatinosus]|nr:hypothetical protein [Rubrivivax gelatinosus]